MAININANMSLGAAEYLDARQSVATLDDLLNLNTNIIPNGFECYVQELDCKYKYHEDYNETDTGNWKVFDIPEFEILDEEDVFEALGMSEEELQNLATIISDEEVRTDKTYSSSKIYEELEKLKNQGGLSGDAVDVGYENESFPDYTNVDLALDALFAKVYYVKPTCSLSANPTGGTFEMGTTITAPITFTWTTNKPITTQTLTNCTLADETVRTATYDTDITSDKTFTLSVSDGENSATSSVSYKFMNNVFWGSAPTGTYDSAFINALSNKKLTTSVKGTYSFNVATGEYGFWAVPSNMTISTVWIGGFEVTVENCGTVSYENSQGYTRDYNIYKTGQSGLGSISAEIK